MKKLLIFFAFISAGFITLAQNSPSKVSPMVPVTPMKIVPPSKVVLIRKDVVKLKAQLSQLDDSISVSKKEIDLLVAKTKNDLESISEMSEMESLRLQMAMDRLSRMMSTLSNLLKKISDTQQTITQNMK